MTWDKYAVGFVFGLALGASFGESPKHEVRRDDVPAAINQNRSQVYDRAGGVMDGVMEHVSPQRMIGTDQKVDYKGIEKHLGPEKSS